MTGRAWQKVDQSKLVGKVSQVVWVALLVVVVVVVVAVVVVVVVV